MSIPVLAVAPGRDWRDWSPPRRHNTPIGRPIFERTDVGKRLIGEFLYETETVIGADGGPIEMED